MPKPLTEVEDAPGRVRELWVMLKIRVPVTWKEWLEEAAEARALSVSALVRQLIRQLMLERPRA